MNKNFLYVMLGVAAGVAVTVLVFACIKKNTDDPVGISGPIYPAPTNVNEIVRPPLQQDSLNRLWDGKKRIVTKAIVTGHGAYGQYGVEGSGDFSYSTTIEAFSEIVKKTKTDYGEIRIEEKRTFETAKDVFNGGHYDVKLTPSKTLPVQELYESTLAVGALVGRWFPITGGSIIAGDAATKKLIEKVDETSLRGLLGLFDVEIPVNLEKVIDKHVNDYLEGKLKQFRTFSQKVQGKTYRIVYTEKASGEPVHVTFTAEDGSIPSDEELAVLRSVNIFLDSFVVPGDVFDEDRREWEVSAQSLDEVFGAIADGGCKGTFKFHRKANTGNGDWELAADPGKVVFLNANGRATGSLDLSSGGTGLVDPTNKYIKALGFAGKGELGIRKTDRRILLFEMMKTIDGECEYSFSYATEPVAPDSHP